MQRRQDLFGKLPHDTTSSRKRTIRTKTVGRQLYDSCGRTRRIPCRGPVDRHASRKDACFERFRLFDPIRLLQTAPFGSNNRHYRKDSERQLEHGLRALNRVPERKQCPGTREMASECMLLRKPAAPAISTSTKIQSTRIFNKPAATGSQPSMWNPVYGHPNQGRSLPTASQMWVILIRLVLCRFIFATTTISASPKNQSTTMYKKPAAKGSEPSMWNPVYGHPNQGRSLPTASQMWVILICLVLCRLIFATTTISTSPKNQSTTIYKKTSGHGFPAVNVESSLRPSLPR
jgi:hypothetical protein